MFIGKRSGFGQKFEPPEPSPYLEELVDLCDGNTRSKVTLQQIRSDIQDNLRNADAVRPEDPVMDEAIRLAYFAFKIESPVKMIHLNDVFKQDLPIWSSSPGLPWTQHGYRTKQEIRDDPLAVQRIRYFWHCFKTGIPTKPPDSCAFVRSHVVKEGESKVRAVWGYPATMTFGEAVFALPLIRAYQNSRSPMAYGFETGTGGMKRIFDDFQGESFLGIDFKKFDKTLPAWLINIAFLILESNIDFGAYQDHGVPVYSSMLKMFRFCADYAVNTTIRMCNGERYKKTSGLASGSYFTQIVDSVCNYILLTYATLKIGATVKDILVFGDDSIIGTVEPITPKHIAVELEPLGMVVNVEKSDHSRDLTNLSFLGYQINTGQPLKPFEKTLTSLVWPERNDRSWDDLASRALGILYSNMGVDDRIDAVCRNIILSRPFEFHLTRDHARLLDMIKCKVNATDPPTQREFIHRLGIG